MKCIVCQHGKLDIVNSRKNAKDPHVWRRRKCRQCGIIFTTKETPDYDRAFYITSGTRKSTRTPFDKATLLSQLFAAGGHLKKQSDLFWLADTIALKAFVQSSQTDFTTSQKEYRNIVLSTLKAYDTLLAANYEARN